MIDELTENGEPVGLGGLVRDTLDVDERDEIEDEDDCCGCCGVDGTLDFPSK